MQLYIIEWSYQNAEDQIFATNEFCKFFKAGKITDTIQGFELKFIAHSPQNGSGVIICRAQSANLLYKFLKMWRENYSITFSIKPAFTNEELLYIHEEQNFWENN